MIVRIENRELLVTFWDPIGKAAKVALLIGWEGDDPSTMAPVVAYDFGIAVLTNHRWKLSSGYERALEKALHWKEEGPQIA